MAASLRTGPTWRKVTERGNGHVLLCATAPPLSLKNIIYRISHYHSRGSGVITCNLPIQEPSELSLLLGSGNREVTAIAGRMNAHCLALCNSQKRNT